MLWKLLKRAFYIEEGLDEEEFFEETTSVVMEELKEEFELEEITMKMSMKEELNEETTLIERRNKEEMKEEEIKEEEIKEEK